MNILTRRNGIALVAVMAVLLILTLLLPLMFTMSENAMKSAMKGTDELRSSYLARTMIEMSVAAFQDQYDAAEEEVQTNTHTANNSVYNKLQTFYNSDKTMTAETICMFREPNIKHPSELNKDDYATEQAYNEAYEEALENYTESGIIYVPLSDVSGVSDKSELISGNTYVAGVNNTQGNYEFVGYADCDIVYDDEIEYYKTQADSSGVVTTEKITSSDAETIFNSYIAQVQGGTKFSTTDPKYSKIEKKNVRFQSTAKINGKVETRSCILVLPTKPAEQSWIAPTEMKSNQIFIDSSKATSVTDLKSSSSLFVDTSALAKQSVYVFSCVGNMVLSTENMKFPVVEGNTTNYYDYATASAKTNHTLPKISDYSLGVQPITTTVKPEHDPTFSCVKTNNMNSWAESGQKDNFVAFTATGDIEVDMPINLLINPCRTGRIGDGISSNESLYKIMYFQAPNIIFNGEVNSFISLYQKTNVIAALTDYNGYRMSSIMLAAPESTPHSYYHGDDKYRKTVKAGKVYFMKDAYVWLVPFTEDGSNYKTQTVYYKGKDIILYKFANAGDVYLFNNEVVTDDGQKAGFSMTGYFMDVLYNKDDVRTDTNTKWYQFWGKMKESIYGVARNAISDPIYVEEDLKYIGNIGSGGAENVPVVDDFYVVWDS